MQEDVYKGISAYVTRVGYDKDEVFAYQETEIKSYCADPVSYTHLDVYKRQHVHRPGTYQG